MTLALVTVLYRSEAAVQSLWASLQAQAYTDWRLIAVDNGGSDGAGAFLAAQGDGRVSLQMNVQNEGFARGANAGLRLAVGAGAERCVLINPDVRFGTEFLGELDAAWADQDVVAPRVMQDGTADGVWYAGGTFEREWAFTNMHQTDLASPSRDVEFASGCCLGLTRAVLDRVGLLDESFFVYWEDADFCMRLAAAGVPISYVREPCLWHEGGASSGGLPGGGEHGAGANRMYYEAYTVFLRKHFGLGYAVKTMARLVAKELERHGRERAAHLGLAMAKGLAAPIRAVPRLNS